MATETKAPVKRASKVKKVVLAKPKDRTIPDKFEIIADENGVLINSGGVRRFRTSLHCYETSISCGVYQLYDMPLNPHFTSLRAMFKSEEEMITLLTKAFTKYFDAIKADWDAAFLMLSCSNENMYSIMNRILEKICATTQWRRNPNSGNDIRVYIY